MSDWGIEVTCKGYRCFFRDRVHGKTYCTHPRVSNPPVINKGGECDYSSQSGEILTDCKCPKCGTKHVKYMNWAGRIPARIYCDNHAAQFTDHNSCIGA